MKKKIHKRKTCRILLGISQRSYTTTRVVQRLKLEVAVTKNLHINAFGVSTELENYNIVEKKVKSRRLN